MPMKSSTVADPESLIGLADQLDAQVSVAVKEDDRSAQPTEATTKSARVRWLSSQGMGTAAIAKLLGMRYQQVYAVIKRDEVSAGRSMPAGAVACKRCQRPLIDPGSAAAGIGPICNGKTGH